MRDSVLPSAPPRPTRRSPRPRRGTASRRRAGSLPEERRRLWSAGRALVVLVLALGFSLLLNAPGAHKKAFNQDEGWRRTVALDLTGPLASVSHALRLDRPRARRAGARPAAAAKDRINTDTRHRPAPRRRTRPSSASRPKPTAKRAFSPAGSAES